MSKVQQFTQSILYLINLILTKDKTNEDEVHTSGTIPKKVFEKLNSAPLHLAKGFWKGIGVPHKRKNSLVINSDKAVNRGGFLSTTEELNSNGTWTQAVNFTLDCHDYLHGEGFGIWMTKRNPVTEYMNTPIPQGTDSNSNFADSMGGFLGRHKGVGVFAQTNSTQSSDDNYFLINGFDQKSITQSTFTKNAKICNRNIFQKGTNMIIFEYHDGYLTTMIKEDDGYHYCDERYADLESFYLSFSSKSQPDHSIHVEINSLVFRTDNKNMSEFKKWKKNVEFADKKQGSKLATELHNQIHNESVKLEQYKAKFKELLESGNKKIVNNLVKSDTKIEKNVLMAMSQLDISSIDMKLLLRWCHDNEDKMKGKFSVYLGKIQNWLHSIDDIYDGMEKEMDEILTKFESQNIDARLQEISTKIDKILKRVDRMNGINKMFSQNESEIVKFQDKIRDIKKHYKKSMKELNSNVFQNVKKGTWLADKMGWAVVLVFWLFAFLQTYVAYKVHKLNSSKDLLL